MNTQVITVNRETNELLISLGDQSAPYQFLVVFATLSVCKMPKVLIVDETGHLLGNIGSEKEELGVKTLGTFKRTETMENGKDYQMIFVVNEDDKSRTISIQTDIY